MPKLSAALLFLLLCSSKSLAVSAPPDEARSMAEVIDLVVKNENRFNQNIRKFSPLAETYIQDMKPDKALGYTPAGDKYYLGRANFSKGVGLDSFTEPDSKGKRILTDLGGFFTLGVHYIPTGFLQMIFIDTNGFDRQHYKFDYVNREFLGEVRCLVFDVTPLPKSGKDRFLGRIWVEDQGYNVVRFNGAYSGGGQSSGYFHFDSWRTNTQPGSWMPSFVYSEENNLYYALSKKLNFKAQTRLWDYAGGHATQEQELSKILVETPVQDDSKTANDFSPLQAQRAWDRQAEEHVVDRLQRIGLIAPKGEVDKLLESVVNNLEVTNSLDPEPDVRCRILLTTTFESFTLGHTIVLSRGLIDVLPDEASLAAILAHELGHIILGHRLDSNYAFFDQLLTDENETFFHFDFARSPEEERAASAKAFEYLNNSPYKGQLNSAAVFLAALDTRRKEIPHLISPHLGNRVPLVALLKPVSSPDSKQNSLIPVALPIGARIKLDPWSDKLELLKTRPVRTLAEREKMPFELTPFMLYLTRFGSDASKPVSAAAQDPPPAPKDNPR